MLKEKLPHTKGRPRSRQSEVLLKGYRPSMSRKVTRTESCCSVKAPFGMRKINEYLLVKKIGVGAYGDVFLAVKPDQEDFTKT